MQPIRRFAGACAAALLCAPAAQAQITVGTGAEYSAGKYGGTETTHNLYIPFSVRYDAARWSFKATLPYVAVSGPSNTVGVGPERIDLDDSGGGSGSGSGSGGSGGSGSGGGDGGGGGSADDAATRQSNAGMGDIALSTFYMLLDERTAGIGLDAGVKVKLGTADREARLGTGENDYSVQADLYKPLGALTVFGTVGYRWYGDPPGIELKDVPYWAIGATYRASGTTTFGASYDYRQPTVAGGDALSEITAFIVNRLTQDWRLQLYGLFGLSDGSPDAGLGLLLQYRFR